MTAWRSGRAARLPPGIPARRATCSAAPSTWRAARSRRLPRARRGGRRLPRGRRRTRAAGRRRPGARPLREQEAARAEPPRSAPTRWWSTSIPARAPPMARRDAPRPPHPLRLHPGYDQGAIRADRAPARDHRPAGGDRRRQLRPQDQSPPPPAATPTQRTGARHIAGADRMTIAPRALTGWQPLPARKSLAPMPARICGRARPICVEQPTSGSRAAAAVLVAKCPSRSAPMPARRQCAGGAELFRSLRGEGAVRGTWVGGAAVAAGGNAPHGDDLCIGGGSGDAPGRGSMARRSGAVAAPCRRSGRHRGYGARFA
jgi:hypothetical protein